MKVRFLVCCLLVLLPSYFAHQQSAETALLEVEVLEIQDGDTFDGYIISVPEVYKELLAAKIDLDHAPFVRVRLLGVNAPEIDHPTIPRECFGEEAHALLLKLLPEGTIVYLELDQRLFDDYDDRLLAYVYLDASRNLMINSILVSSGHAVALSLSPNLEHDATLEGLETLARTNKLGLWTACMYSWTEAHKHADESAIFVGPVASTYYDEGKLTFINIGGAYPDYERLTVVIPAFARDFFIWEFGSPPEEFFENVEVAVFGRIDMKTDSPEIELHNPSYIWINSAEEVPVVIWEVEANPPDEDIGHEWIRLRNRTEYDVDIGGWLLLSKGGRRPAAVRIPANTIIEADGYYIVEGIPFQWLDNKDEVVVLYDRVGNVIDMTPVGELNDDDDSRTWRREEADE